jgi:hypothetical protein
LLKLQLQPRHVLISSATYSIRGILLGKETTGTLEKRVKLNKENTLTLDDEIKDTSLRYAPVPGIQSLAKQRRKS